MVATLQQTPFSSLASGSAGLKDSTTLWLFRNTLVKPSVLSHSLEQFLKRSPASCDLTPPAGVTADPACILAAPAAGLGCTLRQIFQGDCLLLCLLALGPSPMPLFQTVVPGLVTAIFKELVRPKLVLATAGAAGPFSGGVFHFHFPHNQCGSFPMSKSCLGIFCETPVEASCLFSTESFGFSN